MPDERSSRNSLCGIVILIVVSIFFVPNPAFAHHPGPFDFVPPLLFLISIVVVPIALTSLGIVSLKHFKPNLWNYIHSNRFIKIGLYFLVEGLSWFFYRVIQGWSDPQLRFGDLGTDYLVIFPIIPGIILISIGATKFQLSNIPRLIGIIFLAVGIGWVSLNAFSRFVFDLGSILVLLIPAILFFSIGGILTIKYRKSKSKQQDPHGFDRDQDGIGCES